MGFPPGALAGLRVLDVGTLYAGPALAAILGDLGADVIKVEPPGGDFLRQLGLRVEGKSLVWAVTGRNKRAVTLDLGAERGQEIFRRLLGRSDVLVENFPPPARRRFRCTYEDLRAVNPRLVVVSVSCYGRDGPYSGRAGNGTLAEAFAGLTHMTGEADGPPMLTSLPIGDVLGAVQGALGALAACYRRDAGGGGGQHVDVSLYEPVLQFLANPILRYGHSGVVESRAGSRIPGSAPRNVYRTRDGRWVAISAVTDRMAARLLAAMGRDGEADRERFGRQPRRVENELALDAAVAGWVAENDCEAVVETLAASAVPVSAVNDPAALFADPHVAARGSLLEVSDPRAGTLRVPAPSPRLSETPQSVRWTGPEPGEHNREVYAELGLDDADLEALRADGTI